MRLLDLFCGAGGAAAGYNRAGFDVVGVDIKPQPRYPFEFHQADAFEYLREHGHEFDTIHASPPCQKYSRATKSCNRDNHPDLLPEVRRLLAKIGAPYVMENVPGAPMASGAITLCGLMFGLKVFRHRLFESSAILLQPEHVSHKGLRVGDGMYSVAGSGGRWKTWGVVKRDVSKGTVVEWRDAMGIPWMTRRELTQAIPPAYTEYIGRQLMAVLKQEKAS